MQENCTFSIIPYGITMSKIFRCLFLVPHLHYLFAFIPVGHNYYLLFIFVFISSFSRVQWFRAYNGLHAQKSGKPHIGFTAFGSKIVFYQ